MSAFERLLEERNAIKDKMIDSFDEFIEEELKTNPEVKFIGFIGYTPEFNDGDECVFTCYSIFQQLEDYYVDYETKKWFEEYKELSDLESSHREMLDGITEEEFGSLKKYCEKNCPRSNLVELLIDNEDILEDVFNSKGFSVLYFLREDKLVKIYSDYDCGY